VWAFPEPADENAIAVPASAFAFDVANLNSDELFLIAYNVVGMLLPPLWIDVAVTPVNDEPAAYVSFSPVLKKWLGILNIPVDVSNDIAGLNVFWNIGIPSWFTLKSVLLTLFPFRALYADVIISSLIFP